MIRRLTGADAKTFQAVRLRALKERPDAFMSSHSTEAPTPLREIRKRLDHPGRDRVMLGAFVDGTLAGLVGYWREEGPKVRHKVGIWGMYVAPEHRGLGLGRKLMQEALRRIRAIHGVEQVFLAVATTNREARSLYRSMGFRKFGLERNAMKLGKRGLDEEMMVCFLSP